MNPGDTIYFFDVNRRRYAKRTAFHTPSGAPIYRAHFRPVKIAEVRARSYVLDQPCWLGGRTITTLPRDLAKWPRASARSASGFFVCSVAEVDDLCWVDANRDMLSTVVRHCEDRDVLDRVRQVLGVPEVPEVPLTEAE